MKSYIFGLCLLFSYCANTQAQFFTAKSDSDRIRPYALLKERKIAKGDSFDTIQTKNKRKPSKEKAHKGKEDADSLSRKKNVGEQLAELVPESKDFPKASLYVWDFTMDKLQERLNVCMPLDELQISSRFGHRTDPFSKCLAFHDGVDLVCHKDFVYAMLPAVVTKVVYSNKGYGNYVVLNHGRLECLYGHLDKITVKENEKINAGTIIGISGNSGKSTNYHLHIRLRNHGRSVDPLGFIGVLRNYIKRLNEDLAMVVPPPEYKAMGAALNRGNLYAEIVRQEVLFPKVVLAQALLETGYFSSRVCWELNNLFGLRKRNGEYMRFEKWEDSVAAYRDYVQYKYKGGNYFDFLNRIGYAEDRTYTSKVRQIYQTID